MMTYRPASPADAALMSRIGKQTFAETFGHLYAPEDLAAFLLKHSEANWLAELENPDIALRIAEDDGAPAGFAKVSSPTLPYDTDRPTAELRQLYMLTPWIGTGIARALMDWAIGEARRRGAEQMILSVYVDNHRARRFYERYGFEEVGRYVFMVGDHEDDDRIMRLML